MSVRLVPDDDTAAVAYDLLAESMQPAPNCRKCGKPIEARIVWGPHMTGVRRPQIVDGMCPDCAWMEGADDD